MFEFYRKDDSAPESLEEVTGSNPPSGRFNFDNFKVKCTQVRGKPIT